MNFDEALQMDIDLPAQTVDFDEALKLPSTSSRSGKMEVDESETEQHNEYNEIFNPRGGKRNKFQIESQELASFKQLPLSAADWSLDCLQAKKQIGRPYTESGARPIVTTVMHPEKQQPMHVYQTDGEALEAMLRRRYQHINHVRILALAISAQAADLFENETDYPETMMKELMKQAKSILGDVEYCSRLERRQYLHLQAIAQGQAPFGLKVVTDTKYRAKGLPRDDQFFDRYPYLAQPNRGNGYRLTV